MSKDYKEGVIEELEESSEPLCASDIVRRRGEDHYNAGYSEALKVLEKYDIVEEVESESNGWTTLYRLNPGENLEMYKQEGFQAVKKKEDLVGEAIEELGLDL